MNTTTSTGCYVALDYSVSQQQAYFYTISLSYIHRSTFYLSSVAQFLNTKRIRQLIP